MTDPDGMVFNFALRVGESFWWKAHLVLSDSETPTVAASQVGSMARNLLSLLTSTDAN